MKLKEIKPAIAGYLRESQALLNLQDIPDEKVVHDVRVLMKKSRAALKLAAIQLDSVYYNKDIFAFREVGRLMCSWRETAVHRKTLKELKKEYKDIFDILTENVKIADILKKSEFSQETTGEIKKGLEVINKLLKDAGFRIRFTNMNNIDPQLLIKELEVTFKKVSDIYLICRNNPKAENFHKFRKKSKDFLYQLWFFRPLNPSVIKLLEKKLEAMTLNLGKYNDLAQIIKAMQYNYSYETNLPEMDELIVRIREKQDAYLSKIWSSAFKIFCPGQKLVNVLGFKLLLI